MRKVSIILPCYNMEAFVAAAIESVRKQTDPIIEVIAVDDGSTDGTASVLRQCQADYPALRIVTQLNGGVCNARNRGFKESCVEGDYLLFLDADDCLEPGMLAALVKHFEEHPRVGIVRCGYRFIDEKGDFVEYAENKHRYVPRGGWVAKLGVETLEAPFDSVFTLCGMIPSICLIRRSAFVQSGGFDENFGHHHEDADLFIRIALDWTVHYVPQVLVRRRRHAGQNTHSTLEFKAKAVCQENKLYQKWLALASQLNYAHRAKILNAWHFKMGPLESYITLKRAQRYWLQKRYGEALFLGGAALGVYFLSLFKQGMKRRG